MHSQDDLLQNYSACDATLSSVTTSSDEKAAAWRQQILLANHLTRDLGQNLQAAVLRRHMQKLDPTAQNEFLDQRVKAVDSLLNGFVPATTSTELPEFDYNTFGEATCSGVYESCSHWEITDFHLKQQQKQENAKRNGDSLNATVSNVNSMNDSIRQQKAKSNEVKTSRNTLTSYFQRMLQSGSSSKTEASKALQQQTTDQQEQQQIGAASNATTNYNGFRTAREELLVQNMKKFGDPNGRNNGSSSSFTANTPLFNYGSSKKSLGARRTVRSGFVPPVRAEDGLNEAATAFRTTPPSAPGTPTCTPPDVEPMDERLVNIDPKMVELITNEIMHKYKAVDWTDIAGLDYAKSIIKEAVVYPLLRPDIFTGLRRPPRGILLFGPPGTGKTLIGKCIASKSQSTFFSISASSLTSKWVGDGEKMVRALFAVAAVHQPSVVFIDEIDSLLSQRSETEHESSRRLKTEFLVQLDGATTSDDDRILIVGATNRPQELDEAARRRLVRRLYIPLPELEARIQILMNLLKTVCNNLKQNEIHEIGKLTVGYSGADMESLCREASMEPIRSIPAEEMPFFIKENVRPISMQDFITAIHNVRPSVSQEDLKQYTEWNRIYGAGT